MPKLSIEIAQDKLIEFIPILLQNNIKFLVIPDKPIGDLITLESLPSKSRVILDDIGSKSRIPNNRLIINTKMGKVIFNYMNQTPNNTFTSKDIGVYLESLEFGYKASSASPALSRLFHQNNITRILDGRDYYYSVR